MIRFCDFVAVAALVLLLGACTGESPSAPPAGPGRAVDETERVQAHVRALFEATYAPDPDAIIALTHPCVIELLGGESGMRKTLDQLLPGLAEISKVKEISFPAEPTFLTGTANEYVVVPTRMGMSVSGSTVESLDFLFGARKIGDPDWRYVQGSQAPAVLSNFPDFPADYEFPETSMGPR